MPTWSCSMTTSLCITLVEVVVVWRGVDRQEEELAAMLVDRFLRLEQKWG